MGTDQPNDEIRRSMIDYYDARAGEYDDWWYRRGRYDRGPEANASWFSETKLVMGILDELSLRGEVLELAAGTGIWTELLAKTAMSVTAVDSSARVIALNRARVNNNRVTYVRADLFSWRPSRLYDAVVFCFWISHVPKERLAEFVAMVSGSLRPGGKVFFVDSLREPTGTAIDQSLPAAGSQIAIRKLNGGQEFRVIKNFYDPSSIEDLFGRFDVSVRVSSTAHYFLYGIGRRKE